MKILLKWINEYVKVCDLTLDEICDAFVGIGFEVESATYLGENVKGISTCRVLSAEKFTQKLSLCTVEIGKNIANNLDNLGVQSANSDSSVIEVICGAPNVRAGMITAYAQIGAVVKGKTIQIADFAGKKSAGMLCSVGELALTEENFDFDVNTDGIIEFPENTKIGENLAELLHLDDYLLDVSITANRPDCQSIFGLARELAVKLNRPLKQLDLNYPVKAYQGEKMPKILVKDKDLCPLYKGSLVKNVKVAPSPYCMRMRLLSLGHKPINNIVDITNYVLLEVGQPLHAFDLSQIDGEIHVRQADLGEKIVTLDGTERKLGDNLVIADCKKPLAIAGVMGGEFSGIKDGTTDVFLESARFARGHIRIGSRNLGMSSDSSKRYEKGVDFYSVETGRKRALTLIHKLNAGEIVDIVHEDGNEKMQKNSQNRVILLQFKQLESLLGLKVPVLSIKKILTNLGFGVEKVKGGFEVSVPQFREDVDNFSDLAEEIIRFYGYDKLVSEPVGNLPMTKGGISRSRAVINRIERICVANGLFEVKNFSFIPPEECKKLLLSDVEHIRLINPLSEEYSAMRTQLVSSVLNTTALNLSRKNQDFRIFEIDNVFILNKNCHKNTPNQAILTDSHLTDSHLANSHLTDSNLPTEKKMLCAIFNHQNEDFYSTKNFVSALTAEFKMDFDVKKTQKPYFHPNLSADIVVDGEIIGTFGKVHPLVAKNFNIEKDVYAVEIDVSFFVNYTEKAIKFKPLPKYPAVERDLAIVVDESVAVGDIFSTIKSAVLCASSSAFGSQVDCEVELVEVYCGQQVESGKKSVLVRIKLINREKTMTENEISALVLSATDQLFKDFGAKLRQ